MLLKTWIPLIGLIGAAFVFNTSEFIPIALLSSIATDFAMTEAQAGMIISVYAIAVMILSLPLMILFSHMELRKLMLWLMFFFVVFQMLCSIASQFFLLMFARIGVASTHALFWSVISPIAVRIVPEKMRLLAIGMIATGTSIAIVVGLPLGRIIGLYSGWRITFLCIGLSSLAVFLFMLISLPKVPAIGKFNLGNLSELFKNPLLMGIYILTFLLVTASFTGYSYIEPFLKQIACFQDKSITALLMLFGGMGTVATFFFSRFYAGHTRLFLNLVLVCVTLCLFFMFPATYFSPLLVFLCAIWGMSMTGFGIAFQSEIIKNSPPYATSVSMSIFSGIYNLGICCGSLLGGAVCTTISIANIGYAGCVIGIVAFVYWQKKLVSHFQK